MGHLLWLANVVDDVPHGSANVAELDKASAKRAQQHRKRIAFGLCRFPTSAAPGPNQYRVTHSTRGLPPKASGDLCGFVLARGNLWILGSAF